MSEETPPEPIQEPASTSPDVPMAPTPATPPPAAGAGMTPPAPTEPMAGMGTPEPPSAKKGKRTLALVVAVLVVLAAGGAAFAFIQLRGSSDTLMSQVPASADLVATVYLNPAAGQKVNLFRMTDQFPVLGSQSDLTTRLNTLLDQAGQSVGLNHNDFQWIGSQAAIVVDFPGATTPNVEVLINVDDVSAAKATLEKARTAPALSGATWHDTQYKGVTVSSSSAGAGAYAFVGDTLVISSTATGVDSIIDTDQGGPSLADSADFKATSDGLPAGRLAFVYVNVKTLLPLAQSLGQATGVASSGLDISALQAIRGFGMTISAESSGLAMDFNESFDPTKLSETQKAILTGSAHDNPLTNYVPSNAFGLVQLEHLDSIATAAITQLEATDPALTAQLATAGVTGPDGLLSSLTGDMTLEIAPGTAGLPVSGALILGINDPTKFAAAVTKLKDLVASQSCIPTSTTAGFIAQGTCTAPPAVNWQTQDYKGTKISFLPASSGPSIAYASVDGAGFIGIGPDSIKAAIDAKAGQNITSNSNFTTAKGIVPSQAQFFYVDLQGALQAAAAVSPSATLSQAIATLKPIQAIVIGSETSSDHTHSRFMVLIP